LGVLTTAFSQALGGELSDRLGRRRVLALSLWSRAATTALLALAIRGRWPLGWMIAIHLTSTFLAHFFEPAARGWVADHAGARERHRGYALLRTATHGGFAAGPALGGFLAERSYAALFLASAAVCALCAMGVSWLRDDAPKSAPEQRFDAAGALQAARDPLFLRLCALNALISVAMAQLVVPLSLYATRFAGLRDAQLGLLLSLNGAMTVLLQVPAARAMTGVPLSRAIVAGCLAYALGFAWVGHAGGFAALACAVAVITLGELLVPTAVQAVAANMAPARQRGRYLGFLGLSRQLGASIGPAAGCAALEIATARGAAGHWHAVAGVSALAALGFWVLGGRLGPVALGTAAHPDEDPDELIVGA